MNRLLRCFGMAGVICLCGQGAEAQSAQLGATGPAAMPSGNGGGVGECEPFPSCLFESFRPGTSGGGVSNLSPTDPGSELLLRLQQLHLQQPGIQRGLRLPPEPGINRGE